MGGTFGYIRMYSLKDLPFIVLWDTKTGHTWMSDTPAEYYSMWELTARTVGPEVLVGGLGLGLLALLLAQQQTIAKITVVENEPDVVALVQKYMPAKVEVIIGDFLDVTPKLEYSGRHFDTVIADIWETYDGNKELVFDCKDMMEEQYPDARHLFWDAQAAIDDSQAIGHRLRNIEVLAKGLVTG